MCSHYTLPYCSACIHRDYHSTVLSLSDNDDNSEGSGNVVELEDVLGEDNDAEKLLELAGKYLPV